jgi:hypothetical protein
MKPKKSRASEPNCRDLLSKDFLAAYQSDFRAHGLEAIEKLRAENPAKYAEVGARLIMAAAEPPSAGFDSAKSMRDLGIGLLTQVGVQEDAITEQMIEAAIAAQDELVRKLEMIVAVNVSAEIAEEYEERELRQ